MSFVEPSFSKIVKKQFLYKLKAYVGAFSSLVVIQLLGIVVSLDGIGGSGVSGPNYSVSITNYSANVVIIFTMLWAFSTAILVTTKAYRHSDFVFVTNRLSSHLANIFFLVTASIIGAITALLSHFLFTVMLHVTTGLQFVVLSDFIGTVWNVSIGIAATCLYVFLFSAIGYLSGMLVQRSKMFVVLLPAGFIGLLIVGARMTGYEGNPIFEFFFFESSFPIFLVKVIVTLVLSYLIAGVLYHRMEVNQ